MSRKTATPEPAGPTEIDNDALASVAGGGRSQSQCEPDDGAGTGPSKPSGSTGSTIVFVGGWGSSMYQY